MKKNIRLLVMLFFVTSFIYGQEKKHNNIIVFDITGSMIGKPDNSNNKNIWQPSLNLLKKQLNSFPKDEKITLYLFGTNLLKIGSYSTDDRVNTTSRIINKVDNIKTNKLTQQYTCIYKSLNKIIKELDKKYTNSIYLFTDGKNSDGYKGCGSITAQELASNWENKTQADEYLYIFKLKDFSLQIPLGGSIEVIEDALNNSSVFIEPINTVVRISKNNLKSSQQFRITGTGLEYIPNNLTIKTRVIQLKSNSKTEKATTIPRTFNVNQSKQDFIVDLFNEKENINSDIFKGLLSYSFNGIKVKKIVLSKNKHLTISIKDIKTEIIFNNKNEEPKVTTPIKYLLPKPNWIIFLIYGSIGTLLILLFLFIYKKSITFSKGNIHISEPISQNYELRGKTKFDSIKEGCCTDTGISFVIKKGRDNKLKITNKSKDTILYINNRIESTEKLISRRYTVKLVRKNRNITFKYI